MEKLRIALQKSGRLSEDSLELLKACGVKLNSGNKQVLRTVSPNYPLEIFFMRDDDIPEYVSDGIADIGIVGENVYLEKKKDCRAVESLGFSKCRLSIAIDKNIEYEGMAFFNGKRIATSYPNILRDHLKEHNIDAEIHEISGSVELAPGIGLADGICDIVSSGSTLFSNGLKEVETILRSEAILISGPSLSAQKEKHLEDLLFRIQAVNKGRSHKYILMNAPNDKIDEITKVLPGMRSPTVLPLAEEGWSSLHAVMSDDAFWNDIDKLKELGAEGILVVPIQKMVS